MIHSPLANPTRTREVLTSFGLFQKKHLGQNFLVDDRVVGRTLDLAALTPGDVVLELGPGIGTLSVALCQTGARVVAVEADRRLLPVLEETTAACEHFAVVHADAVKVGLEEITAPYGPPTALVANLPYEVAATLVLRFFQELPSLRSATVMVQAEVADRMAAEPGTKAYGAYTVKLGLYSKPGGRFAVGRGAFMPPPRVDSTVLRLDRIRPVASGDVLLDACEVARAAFAQRRKTLRNSLSSALGREKADIDAALEEAGVDGTVRAETLGAVSFVEMALVLRKRGILP